MNIRVDLDAPIYDGKEVVFRSPADCSQVTGLILYYGDTSQEFMFADAHGNNVGDIDHLFAENVVVKVIIDLKNNMAFVQNADTNAYLEQRIDGVDLTLPHEFEEEQKSTARANIGAAGQIVNTAEGNIITLNDTADSVLQGLELHGTGGASVTVKVMGRNAYNFDPQGTGIIVNVSSYERLENGILAKGKEGNGSGDTNYANGWLNPINQTIALRKGDVVTVSCDYTMLEYAYGTTATVGLLLNGTKNQTTTIKVTVGEKKRIYKTFTVTADGEYYPVVTFNSGKAKIENIQIAYGTNVIAYEPYKEVQTLVVNDPTEIDFTQLHTYKPTTTIINDIGAEMAVTYLADLKNYIDKKFNELATAMIANT